ncbi:hypothetical protein C8R34_10939 [Nitrosomonas sp. Nm84]|nr:hypothetical protein C8R34_10939 [Nitrosomonas sp. Nm84]
MKLIANNKRILRFSNINNTSNQVLIVAFGNISIIQATIEEQFENVMEAS